MIDLTPLDVRKKKGDFRRGIRGYEPAVVDDFLDLVAERLEELVRENATLRQRVEHYADSIETYREREQAMNEALVSAQQIREAMRDQASRESEIALKEARAEAEAIVAEARRRAEAAREAVRRLHTQRAQFVRAFRAFVERQLMEIEQEEERIRDLARADAEPGPRAPAPRRQPEGGAGRETAQGGDEPPDWLTRIDAQTDDRAE